VRHLPPKRVANRTVRTREYLTPDEIEQLIRAAARVGRHRHRDATLLLVAYRHGLRVGELVSLRWDQVDLGEAVLRVIRSKNGTPSNHPIGQKEIRALRRLRREHAGHVPSQRIRSKLTICDLSALVVPESFKPIRRELRVAHGVHDVSVPEVVLDRSGVLAVVSKLVAARVAEHVRVHCEG
jgi:integrase